MANLFLIIVGLLEEVAVEFVDARLWWAVGDWISVLN